jgi:hypothetical protein
VSDERNDDRDRLIRALACVTAVAGKALADLHLRGGPVSHIDEIVVRGANDLLNELVPAPAPAPAKD